MAKKTSLPAKPLAYEDAVLLGFLIATQRDNEIEVNTDEEGYFPFSIQYASGSLRLEPQKLHNSMYALRDSDLLDMKFKKSAPQMYCKVNIEGLKKLAIC